MGEDLLERIGEDINNYNSIEQLREEFIKKGYLEKDIDDAIQRITQKSKKVSVQVQNARIFTFKEILDRLGYGFVTHQFINILFFLTGAGYLLIGIMNCLKSLLSILLSSVLKEYSKVHELSKGFMSKSGILFGFSFLLMAAGIKLRNLWIFSIALLLGCIGVVSYGDFYSKIIRENLKKEKMNHFLVRISYYGVLITALTFLLSGYLMDKFPIDGPAVMIMGARYPIYGYLISFEISAFAFILSGYFIYFLSYKTEEKKYRFSRFIAEYFKRVGEHTKIFFKNRLIFLSLLLTIIVSVVQILGNSYYGIYIYRNFNNLGLGGFLNVAVIFSIAIIVSLIAPFFTKKIEKLIGLSPMIVFGALLMAFMPFTLAYNPNLNAIGLANAVSTLGAVIVGVSLGLLAKTLMSEQERKMYYSAISIISIIPFLVLIPLGAYVAQTLGLTQFFVLLSVIIAIIIMPLSFILVYLSSKEKMG
ncbi:MAG: MFS transporter [Nanoarchaeota archaeon]